MFQEMLWHQSQSYEHQREVDQIYRDTVDYVIDDINAFFERYGEREGISKREVVKTVKQTDLNLLANRVREYVENEDFSPEANAMLKEYNLTGRTNRAALLKQKIDLATHQLANEEEKLIGGKLSEEITHQMEVAAGIWEMSVPEVDTLRSMATAIKNKPFKGGVWSERLWDRQEALAGHLSGIVDKIILKGQSSTTMIDEVRQAFDTSAYVAKRLLVTETARVQSETQKELMLYNEFEEYRFLAEPTACEHCMELNEKVFKVEDMMPGVNSSPIHPNCRCSAAPEYGEIEELMIEPPQEEVEQDSVEQLRRMTKERIDRSNFRGTLTIAQYKQFMKEFDSIEDKEILQMYHDHVEEIAHYTRGGRGSYYSPRYDQVNIKPSSTHPTKEKRQQFGVIHHEMGHAFDTKLFERLRRRKTGRNSKLQLIHEISSIEAYDLDGKIVRDFENTILNRDLRKVGAEPPRYIDGEFNDEYDRWDIDRRYNEITKENNLDSFINEYREYGSKSREHQSTMAALSDILESTGQTPNAPMRWGHGEDYWKRSDSLRTSEFFAHATQLRAHNAEGYEILKEYFPESVATYEEMVSDALGVDK